MNQRYVPILKGKEGEFSALEAMPRGAHGSIKPLIEVPPIPYDYANDRPSKTLDDHTAGIADRLGRCWPGGELYVDLPWFEAGDSERLSDGRAAVERVLGDCHERRLAVTAVVSTRNSREYLEAARQHAIRCQSGPCIRLRLEDFDEDGQDPRSRVEDLLRAVGSQVPDSDLLIDLGELTDDVSRATLLARSVIGEAPYLQDWRRVIIAASSFPENLSDVEAATTVTLPRLEWQLWQRLQRRSGRADIVFGDYAISHPVMSDLDPRVMRMSASIRYTTDDDWLIVKGRNVRQYGFEQYFDLCRTLVARREFKGEAFSWGDAFIASCARGATGPGNATTWRKVGTNHHLTLVSRALATSVV